MILKSPIVIVRLAVAFWRTGIAESVTVITAVLVDPDIAVPLIAPVGGLIARPTGRPVADQVYGGTPPAAATVAE